MSSRRLTWIQAGDCMRAADTIRSCFMCTESHDEGEAEGAPPLDAAHVRAILLLASAPSRMLSRRPGQCLPP